MKRARAGNSCIEFTLVGIPTIFIVISTMEMARGMWAYNSLGHTAREAARFASRKGENCASAPNDCSASVADIVDRSRATAFGIPPNELNVSLTSVAGTTACAPVNACAEDESMWPPAAGNAVGAEITVTASYRFRSAIAMFWPGAGASQVHRGFLFEASSTERIGF
jgi:Flp pilus assembly protein TadG